MFVWVKCKVGRGMLAGEFAVEIETYEAARISLFAPEDKVKETEGLMQVEMLHDGNGSGVIVSLPSQPFEVPSQTVRVRQAIVIK